MLFRTTFRLALLSAIASFPSLCAAQNEPSAGTTPARANFTTCAKPAWPKEALRKEQSGTVQLAFLIGADGAVKDSRVEKSSGFPLLDEAAQTRIMRCRFQP